MTARQRRFVAEYVVDLNASAAAIRSGYTGPHAHTIGWHMLQKPQVAAAVEEYEAALCNSLRITTERVLIQAARIAFADQRRLFKPDGTLKDVADMDADTLAAVSIEVVETPDGSLRRIRPRDPVPALKMLGRYLRMWREKSEMPDGPIMDTTVGEDFERFAREEEELAEFRRQAAKRLGGPSE